MIMTVADFIADFLYRRGIRSVFMLSGTGSIHLDDAFARCDGMRYICARHEAAAAAMAAGYAKLSGALGVVVATTGPGGTNAIGGLVEAWVDSVPVLVISGQVPREQISIGVRSFGVQGFNITENVKGLTKYSALVDDPLAIRFHLEKAIFSAFSGRPGPVWLDIPMDVQASEIDPSNLQSFEEPDAFEEAPSIEHGLTAILESLSKSEKPLIVVGQGVRGAGAIPEFAKLAEVLNAPVIASRMGLDILSFDHPNYCGYGGIRGHRHSALIMGEADFILCLGSSIAHPFAGERFEFINPDSTVAMVNIDEAEMRKPGLRVDIPIKFDVKSVISTLLDKLNTADIQDNRKWLGYCKELQVNMPTVLPEYRGNPINSYFFIQQMQTECEHDAVFVSDAGSSYYITGQALELTTDQRELSSGAFASMGMAIPLAIGASAANPDAQVIVVTGDGSIELNIQELRTISQNQLAIKIFVINNGGYASTRQSQDSMCGGRYTDDQEILDFSKVAAAFELPFRIINDVSEIGSEVRGALAATGPILVEVVCDDKQEIIAPKAVSSIH